MIKVLFVCMGNICRSPTAEGVFREQVRSLQLLDKIQIDSAGTHSYHIGSSPDRRSQQAAQRRGVDISQQQARHVEDEDFVIFDYILAMDKANHADLLAISPSEYAHKVHLYLSFAKNIKEQEVPDPYYGGHKGFDHVLDLVEHAADGFIQHLREKYKL